MIPIRDVMSTNLIYVTTETPIYEALCKLKDNKVSGLPVVSQTLRVVGILTEKDILRLLLDKNLVASKVVSDYMTREVICFGEDDNAIDLCKFFIKSNIRRVPIVRQGVLVGVISRRDMVPLILEAQSKMSDFRYV